MGIKVITAAANQVALADLRLHLRLDATGSPASHSDDARIQAMLAAACQFAEHHTGRSVGEQTLELALDAFPTGPIELPLGAASIVYVKYADTAGVVQTLDASAYVLDNYSHKHWLLPATGTTWPATLDAALAVKVRYTTPAAIPATVTQALLLMVGHLYTHVDKADAPEYPAAVKALLDTQKVWSL